MRTIGKSSRLLLVAAAVVVALSAVVPGRGQRRVSPVVNPALNLQGKNENRNPGDSIDYSRLARFEDEQGNVILVDTISGKEIADTAAAPATSIPKMKQPLLFGASVGVDIWDPVMRIFGQKYGLVEFSAELNLHNRYIPVVEVGIGEANSTPENQNFTYKVDPTPYFRIGANYNFLYNSNPDYMVYAGLRFGWSSFTYQINDVRLTDDYWGESALFNLPRQKGSWTYIQVLFGLKVRIVDRVSLGWSIRYKAKLHESAGNDGLPWYIPGFGTRNSPITASFSIFYTIPFRKSHPEPILND